MRYDYASRLMPVILLISPFFFNHCKHLTNSGDPCITNQFMGAYDPWVLG